MRLMVCPQCKRSDRLEERFVEPARFARDDEGVITNVAEKEDYRLPVEGGVDCGCGWTGHRVDLEDAEEVGA